MQLCSEYTSQSFVTELMTSDNPLASQTPTAKPLRIVHYLPEIRLEHGGVVRAVLDWCTVFSQRGHQVTLITYQGKDMPTEWLAQQPGKPRGVVVPEPWLPTRPLGRRAMKVADDALREADMLHLHAPWFDGNRQLANLARRRGVPYLVTVHGMLDDWAMAQRGLKKKIFLKLVAGRMLDKAAFVHCTAEAEWQQASKWFGNCNKVVLPYLVDLKPFESLPGKESGLALLPPKKRDEAKILFLSRLHEKKGVDILIRAAGILRDKKIAFTLMIAGNGEAEYERSLHDLVASLKLNDRVVFLGLITGITKISLYQAADIFVLPTHQENFGLVLTEAMACGTPVVTTKGTDIWQEVQTAGGTIAQTTPESIAGTIEELLSDRENLSERGARGQAWAFETLAVEPLARRYEQLYWSMKKTLNAER